MSPPPPSIYKHFDKLEAQWVEHVSLTFHSALRKLPPNFGSFGKAVSE